MACQFAKRALLLITKQNAGKDDDLFNVLCHMFSFIASGPICCKMDEGVGGNRVDGASSS